MNACIISFSVNSRDIGWHFSAPTDDNTIDKDNDRSDVAFVVDAYSD